MFTSFSVLIYSNLSKYVLKTGGSITGKIICVMANDPQFQCKNTTSNRLMAVGASDIGAAHLLNYLDSNNSTSIHLTGESDPLPSRVQLAARKDGVASSYMIYGSHNITKGTTALISGTSELTAGCIYLQVEG